MGIYTCRGLLITCIPLHILCRSARTPIRMSDSMLIICSAFNIIQSPDAENTYTIVDNRSTISLNTTSTKYFIFTTAPVAILAVFFWLGDSRIKINIMSSTITRDNVDVLSETAENIQENEDAIETKLDIMSMPVYIGNEPMNIDEVIGKGYSYFIRRYILYPKGQHKLF